MNLLRELRIGYVPCSTSLNAPGDRRRFCYYANRRNIRFEIARPDQAYDIVVLTQSADISLWSRYSRERTKIIFDFIDAYLSISNFDLKGLLRGAAKFAVRQNRRLLLSYTRGLQEMCRRADAVICSTEEQKRRILAFCSNVHIILDFHGNVAHAIKDDYTANEIFHFVWEGRPENLRQLLEIKEDLRSLQKTRLFVIHAITDLQYGRYLGGRFVKRTTIDDARKIWPNIYLYAWNELTFAAIARKCDLALIPIPLNEPLSAAKPENRLLLFWRMAMPVLASSTAAHLRAMSESGLEMSCASHQEWRSALEYYTGSEQARKQAGQRGKTFVEEKHSEEKTLALWDQAFNSVLAIPSNTGDPNNLTLCSR